MCKYSEVAGAASAKAHSIEFPRAEAIWYVLDDVHDEVLSFLAPFPAMDSNESILASV